MSSYSLFDNSDLTGATIEMNPLPCCGGIVPSVTTVRAVENTRVAVFILARWDEDNIDHPAVSPVLRRPLGAGLQKLGPDIRAVIPVRECRIRGEVRPGTRSPGVVGPGGDDEYVLVRISATARTENGGGRRTGTNRGVGSAGYWAASGRGRNRWSGWDGVGCRIFFGTASDRRLPGQMGGTVINAPRGSLSLKHRRRDRPVRVLGVRSRPPGRTPRGDSVRRPPPKRRELPV
jgi:hypothetical protein